MTPSAIASRRLGRERKYHAASASIRDIQLPGTRALLILSAFFILAHATLHERDGLFQNVVGILAFDQIGKLLGSLPGTVASGSANNQSARTIPIFQNEVLTPLVSPEAIALDYPPTSVLQVSIEEWSHPIHPLLIFLLIQDIGWGRGGCWCWR